VDSPTPSVAIDSAAPLEPRYRRILSFGDVLDESIRVWRQHWVNFALFSAVALLPPGLLLVFLGGQGLIQSSFLVNQLGETRTPTPAQIGTIIGVFGLYFIVSVFFGLLWTGAVITATDRYLRGADPTLGTVYGAAFKRFVTLLLGGLVLFGGTIGLTVLSGLLFIPTLAGLLGGPLALICLLIWWFLPGSRRTWFKWLIILAAPFGILFYVVGRWSMYVASIVLERQGPVDALRRSWALTEGHWFRVAGILLVATLIVSILVSVVTNVVQVPLTVSAASRGQAGLAPGELALVYGINVIFQVLFSSIAAAVYVLLFNDLRNRREGTDIAERLSELEGTSLTTNV
jgi:hypothetical protein